VAADGSLLIVDSGHSRLRVVSPTGTINTLAGGGDAIGDKIPPASASLTSPLGVAILPSREILIADNFTGKIHEIGPSLPGVTPGDVLIPAEDASEVYVFGGGRRHTRTVHGLTGATLLSFAYDSAGRLASVTDGSGNITAIQHDGSGNPTAIVAPGGQTTSVAVDSDGYLARVTQPGSAPTLLAYNTGLASGQLATLTEPGGGIHRFTYGTGGRLTRDTDPRGGFSQLARSDIPGGHLVTVTTAAGATSTYSIETLASGDKRRVETDPAGARTTYVTNPNGTETVTYADGTTAQSVQAPDQRWGMLAPGPSSGCHHGRVDDYRGLRRR
jgi:YD repeat-containing protein